jgi:hypothetical protein
MGYTIHREVIRHLSVMTPKPPPLLGLTFSRKSHLGLGTHGLRR